MPEDYSDNMDDAQNELPEKYRGKTPQQLAEMHQQLEALLGAQGQELGGLRDSVQRLTNEIANSRAAATPPADTGRVPKERYKKYADRLLIDPENTVPEMVEEMKAEVRAELAGGMSAAEQRRAYADNFMRENPEMVKVKEIFGEVGDRIARANPRATFEQVLNAAKQETEKYLVTLRERGVLADTSRDPKKNQGITTSGGRTRDTMPDSGSTEDRAPEEPDNAILREVASLKTWREKRMGTRRAT